MERLKSDAVLMANARAKSGIEEMGTLFTYLDAYGVIDKVRRCPCMGVSAVLTVYALALVRPLPRART